MRTLTVGELMTREVITVVPDTPFAELVGLMVCHDLDLLPVIDSNGRPVGMVSACDLLAKLEFHGGVDQCPILAGGCRRTRWRKATGRTAEELMSSPVVGLYIDTDLVSAARTFVESQHRQLCVVDPDNHLVGMLNRVEILTVFLRGDAALSDDVSAITAAVVTPSIRVEVTVENGVAHLDGVVRLRSTADELVRRASRVPGLIGLECHVRYEIDDFLITGI
jgi:CBS domain-containing protein